MRLDEYLDRNGTNPSWFAKKLGVSRTAFHRWRSGLSAPSSLMAVRIKEMTGGAVTADDFAEHQVERQRAKIAA